MRMQPKYVVFVALMILCNFIKISADPVQVSTDQAPEKQIVMVSVPVADIRLQNPETNEITAFILPEKSADKSVFFSDNKFQETQVLFGDILNIIKEAGDWAFVEIPKQKHFIDAQELVTCKGWINKNAITKQNLSQGTNLVVKSLWAPMSFKTDCGEEKFNVSFGTKLVGKKMSDGSWNIALNCGNCKISEEHVEKITRKMGSIKDLRVDLIERAKLFLTSPYIWGGASAPVKFYPDSMPENMLHQASGVDCSGLVYILFKSFGLICPRNSNDQYIFSEKIKSGKNLKPGDLVFFSKVGPDGKTPQRVSHVEIYAGNDLQENTLIIESQGVAEPFGVRLIETTKLARLGNKQLSEIKSGDVFEWTDERNKTINLSCISFGSFLTAQKIKFMRLLFDN